MLTVQKIKLNEISSSERNGLRVFFIWLWWLELVYSSFSHPRAMLVCGAFNFYVSLKGHGFRTSLVVQQIRIHLPVQRTQVWSLVREASLCLEASKLVHHECWAGASCSATREAAAVRSLCTAMRSSPCSLQLEKAWVQQRRSSEARKKPKIQNTKKGKLIF